MHFYQAINAIGRIRDRELPYTVEWVSPVLSCLVAAGSIADRSTIPRIDFSPAAEGYATSCGLIDVLAGKPVTVVRSGRQGSTYTRLTRLATHSEVDHCNSVINDLIFEQFSGFSESIVSLLAKVVGELHDNVASHASGVGFSAAQVYTDGFNRRIEFAIVDAGCGMLKNVRSVNCQIQSDPDAIDWCLKRGHTTARNADNDWEQLVPEDMAVSPFPVSTPRVTSEDHHFGEGLWTLSELIRITRGSLWILSGAGEYRYLNEEARLTHSQTAWPGVAIEFELMVPRDSLLDDARETELESLGKRLGI